MIERTENATMCNKTTEKNLYKNLVENFLFKGEKYFKQNDKIQRFFFFEMISRLNFYRKKNGCHTSLKLFCSAIKRNICLYFLFYRINMCCSSFLFFNIL